ncbi:MAG: hypothetical protein U1D55_17365 [Phycisphaerae bacterium]
MLRGREKLVPERDAAKCDLTALNENLIEYINFGGYPELVLSEAVRRDPQRFVKNDVIDKVLLRDLPSLYGISDVQELNYLFSTLAYNTGEEVSLDELSKRSGVAKNTIKRYIEYLEAAFLIRVVHRLDRDGRRFQRARQFKVYLTNPSMRAALFSPVSADDPPMGPVIETAIFCQLFHVFDELNYARWPKGEVDIVSRGARGPRSATEIKWSDRVVDHPEKLEALLTFAKRHGLDHVTVTTRTRVVSRPFGNVIVRFVPAALYCALVGDLETERKSALLGLTDAQARAEAAENRRW